MPAVNRAVNCRNVGNICGLVAPINVPQTNNKEKELMTKITHFVESMRINEDVSDREKSMDEDQPDRIPGYDEAKRRAEKAILDVEHFKAAIAEPDAGKILDVNLIQSPGGDIGSGLTDDDFHLTCHVDSTLISKIEKGEFVELQKLVPKDKRRKSGDDNRLEWIHQALSRTQLTRLQILGDGNKFFMFMPQLIVEQILPGQRKYGNMCQLLIQL